MAFLTKDEILNAQDLPFEDVEAWGGTVRIGTMTGAERDDWEAGMFDEKGKPLKDNKKYFRASLLVRAIKDEENKSVFSAKEIPALAKKSALEINKLYEIARRLNGIGRDVEEELEKNSGSAPEDDSTSG